MKRNTRILALAPLFWLLAPILPARAQETQSPRTALELLPPSTWYVSRIPSLSRLEKLLENHPAVKLYSGDEKRREIWKKVEGFFSDKMIQKVEKVSPRMGAFFKTFLQESKTIFSSGAEPYRIWIASSRFGMALSLENGLSGQYNPGFLIILEFSPGREGGIEGLQKNLTNLWKKCLEAVPGTPVVSKTTFHGKEILKLGFQRKGNKRDVLFLARHGRFLALSFATPWPLYEAQMNLESPHPATVQPALKRIFQESPEGTSTFALNREILPSLYVPEPIPLALKELGLGGSPWVHGRWNPASGEISFVLPARMFAGSYLAHLSGRLKREEFASMLPADTAAFLLVPLDWKGLAARWKPLLAGLLGEGALPGGFRLQDVLEGFEKKSLLVSPLPLLAGTKEMGVALRFNRGFPSPDLVVGLELTRAFKERIITLLKRLVEKDDRVRVTRARGLDLYRGPWLHGVTFVFKGNWVFFTFRPSMIRGFLPVLAGKAPSLGETPRYKSVRASLGDSPCLGFYYVDGARAVRIGESAAGIFLAMASSFTGISDLPELLHFDGDLEENLKGYGGGLFLEKEGLVWRSNFPFSPVNLLLLADYSIFKFLLDPPSSMEGEKGEI